MSRYVVIAAVAAALLAAGLPPAQAQNQPPAPKRELRVYGEEVMTPEERQAYIDKMRAAKTREERAQLRSEHRAAMQKRAQEKGVTLQEPRRGGEDAKADRRSKTAELFTADERAAFRQRLKEAKTPEERDQVRAEMRAQADARAKEKGIPLREPRAPRGPGPAPEAPKT
jgi:hypothetical protein